MQKQILQELRELKNAISTLIGSSELPLDQKFSKEALDKSAKEFQKLSIERGEWVEESNIRAYIKTAKYYSGAFIREEFGFKNFFKRGRIYYYNKKDLIALGSELKERNINLGLYMDLKADQANFKKSITDAGNSKKSNGKGKAYDISDDLSDITSTPIKMPSADIIKEDLARLKEEFFQYNLTDYVTIYKGNYAMIKGIYFIQKYLEPGLKKRCKRWCEDFNYANHAYEEVTKKKENFISVKSEDMIQL